jgi:hypothetical protein
LQHKSRALALILALAACDREPPGLRPPGDPEDFLRAADIIAAAQCELDAAATRSGPQFFANRAEITLTLLVQVSESTGGGLTLTIPIGVTDLTLRRDRAPEGTALRVMDFQITHDFGTSPACPSSDEPLTETGLRFIEGGLGLSEWVTETDRLVALTGRAPSEVNYAMSFDVTLSDNLSPEISRPIDSVGAAFARQSVNARDSRHRIAVTILPGVPSEDALREAADRFLDRLDG